MTQSPAYIKNAVFSANVKLDSVNNLTELFALSLGINFDNVSDLISYNGVYTPNNDYIYVFNNIQSAVAPTFAIISCDGLINITALKSVSGILCNQQLTRLGFIQSANSLTDFLQSMYIDGRTTLPFPMVQGVPVNYSVLAGIATIS